MPTINMYGKVDGSDSDEDLAVFLALCARIGAKDVFCPKMDYQDHFFALGNGVLLNFCADYNVVEQVAQKIAAAGIKVMPYPGRITLDSEWELEKLERHVQETARNAAGRYLLACPKCKRAVGNNQFCPYCGAECDSHLRWCAKCKRGYPPAFEHCTHCGGPLEQTGQWVFDYLDPEDIFDGVYLTEEEANIPPDDNDYL